MIVRKERNIGGTMEHIIISLANIGICIGIICFIILKI